MVMRLEIDVTGRRAKLARLGRTLSGWRLATCWLIGILLGVLGVLLLLEGQSIGWLLLGSASIPCMVIIWRSQYLLTLPPSSPNKAASVDAVLAAEVLGRLKPGEPVTVAALAEATTRTRAAGFMGARLGLAPTSVVSMANNPQVTIEAVLSYATALQQSLGEPEISSAMLIASIIAAFPYKEEILAQLHLDEADVLEGARWYHEFQESVRRQQQPRRDGGLARDLAFGFTPLLQRLSSNISQQVGSGQVGVEVPAQQEIVERMIDVFAARGRQNVTLVGSRGVGKSTIVRMFAQQLMDGRSRLPAHLQYHQVISLDAAAIISVAPNRGELEALVNQVLVEAYSAKNIIVLLENAELFFEEGAGSVDIATILLPILEAGRLRMILTMDEQRLLQIAQSRPGIIAALNRITVPATDKHQTMRILEDQLLLHEYRRGVRYTYQALQEVYRLSQRYVQNSSMPGQALQLLESAAGFPEQGLVTRGSVQQAIEQTLGVKVGDAQRTNERQKLLDLESLLHQRMVGQDRAVSVVSDALRRAQAGVRNENRPIGTFLFLGPTGVGKTELSKALAETYFSGEQHMVRIDLNEYVQEADVSRLIADAAHDPGSLAAQISKQPFSVVLLDEIEKAHPLVLTTLLQVLDEGILRDINNAAVSFRDAIIIATSNAGADYIRERAAQAGNISQFEEQLVNQLITTGQFKPEFLNRFDEIVLFEPLQKDDLLQIIDLIIAGVNRTLASQKVAIEVEEAAKQLLVDAGYDPQLGARPMRRIVQRTVENLVARKMLAGELTAGQTLHITKNDVASQLGI